MAFFSYKARAGEGSLVKGLVEAPNQATAIRLLHEKQLFVISLVESKSRGHGSAVHLGFSRVPFGEIVNFTRQLATMVMAGLSLSEALTILRSQTSNQKFSDVLAEVEHAVVSGGNLADSLAKYPQYFSPIYVSLISAGEASGTLDEVLTRLSETLEAQREFRSKVTGAMIYPAIIVVGMVVVVMIMMTVVVPKLTDLYRDFGVSLPASTQLLMDLSSWFVRFWWLAIAVGTAGIVGFVRWRKTTVGELMIDSFLLRLPILGELQKKVILVEFTRTLSMLIGSGIRLLDALQVLKGAVGNVLFRNAIADVARKVERGFPLGETFAQYPVFPPIVAQMMKVGEETGKLDDTLLKLSGYFESESEHLVKGLTTAIEPIIMVILGVGVGFIVISVITPIYNLTSQFK